MSSSVTLTAGVRNNLLALQQTTAQETTTQQRLATGKKVNSALDNPTNFFTAAALSSRATELTGLLDSMTNGVNTINAANNGLTSITTTIQSMEATVTQARQDASWQSTSFTVDTTTIGTSSLKSVGFTGGSVGSTTVNIGLNDQETLTGVTTGFTAGAASTGAGTAGTLTIQAADINGGTAVSVSVATTDVISQVAANINAAVGYTLATVSSGNKLVLTDAGPSKISVGGGTVDAGVGFTTTTSSATVGAVSSVDTLVTAINNNTSLAGFVKASNNAGQLQITNLSTSGLTVSGVGSSGKVDGSAGTSTIAANSVRANLVTQFNALRDQLDKTASDSSFNGINLLTGDQLKLFFNELSTSSLAIQSTNVNGVSSASLGITAATITEFQTNTQLDTRLASLHAALTTVASQASA